VKSVFEPYNKNTPTRFHVAFQPLSNLKACKIPKESKQPEEGNCWVERNAVCTILPASELIKVKIEKAPADPLSVVGP
jgi:hypothetical protein